MGHSPSRKYCMAGIEIPKYDMEKVHTQSAHPCCLNIYLQLQILAALLKLTAVLNISCTHSVAELLSFSI